MKIEKTNCSYHVTECDLKFGEQITLGEELLIPASVLDKIVAQIEGNAKYYRENINTYVADGLMKAVKIIDKYRGETTE